jgi:hypothetical protein
MRLLRTDTEELRLRTFNDESNLPQYAILSHTWLPEVDDVPQEVLYSDLADADWARTKAGWGKLAFARKQAKADGLNLIWIDTCCIDKSSSAELSEAINSMYWWYKGAKVCYVYLDDMPGPLDVEAGYYLGSPVLDIRASIGGSKTPQRIHPLDDSQGSSFYQPRSTHRGQVIEMNEWTQRVLSSSNRTEGDLEAFKMCRWFTRGWTLQEMLASPNVCFFNREWKPMGWLSDLATLVSLVTGIHQGLFLRRRALRSFSIAQRMSWSAKRTTTRIEDRAYSLLGIFDISLTVIYGEGERAFQRLQEELLRVYSDHTIFAWGLDLPLPMGASDLLARSPEDFQLCSKVVPTRQDERQHRLEVMSRAVNLELPTASECRHPLLLAPGLSEEIGSLHEDRELPPGSDGNFASFSHSTSHVAVLSCSTEDDDTLRVVMGLMETPSGTFLRTSVAKCDMYFAAVHYKPRQLNIMRHANEELSPATLALKKEYSIRILCRVDKLKKDVPINIADASAQLVFSPSGLRSVVDRAGIRKEVGWDQVRKCFMLPSMAPPDDTDLPPPDACDFEGQLFLDTAFATRGFVIDIKVPCHVYLSDSGEVQSVVSMSSHSAVFGLTRRPTNFPRPYFLPLFGRRPRRIFLTARFESIRYMQDDFFAIVVDVGDRWSAYAWFLGRALLLVQSADWWRISGYLGLLIILGGMPMLIALSGLLNKQYWYDPVQGMAIDIPEVQAGIQVGVPFVLTACIVGVYISYLGWRGLRDSIARYGGLRNLAQKSCGLSTWIS